MTAYTIARSLSRPVKQLFLKGEFTAQVLGMFENACDLVTPAGDVVALWTFNDLSTAIATEFEPSLTSR